jgi:hypothetical protein
MRKLLQYSLVAKVFKTFERFPLKRNFRVEPLGLKVKAPSRAEKTI